MNIDTGFTFERAAKHEETLERLIVWLAGRGYKPRKRVPMGDMPDLDIEDLDGRPAYLDFKEARPDYDHFVVKLGALECFIQLDRRVYIVWGNGHVDTAHTAMARIAGGPHRSTPTGSRTDFVLVRRRGATWIEDFFPDRTISPGADPTGDSRPQPR